MARAETLDAEVLTGPDPKASNDWDGPGLIRAEPFAEFQLRSGELTCRLPPMSFTAASVRLG